MNEKYSGLDLWWQLGFYHTNSLFIVGSDEHQPYLPFLEIYPEMDKNKLICNDFFTVAARWSIVSIECSFPLYCRLDYTLGWEVSLFLNFKAYHYLLIEEKEG